MPLHWEFKLGLWSVGVKQVPRRYSGAAEGLGGITLQPMIYTVETIVYVSNNGVVIH